MLKKSKVIAGICFIAQAFTCLVLALVYGKKKKALSGTFLALGAVGGIAGAWLLYDECKKVSDSKLFDLECCDCEDEDCNELFSDLDEEDINFSIVDEEEAAEQADAE